MATIKAIDGRTIHQIQSGQVIVDLCSVVKELVENSIDAGASSVDVRLKNQGLDLIEVQDNGGGISPANYDSIALKHHTSKLSTYADIGSLETFGFRGEALASLCALSTMTVTTCLPEEVPKGTKLTFEASGKLGGTGVVAAQKGTTVSVEKLFHNLPVRRRELERNIKREWQKVITLLNQYACIQTNTKFSVSQQPTKGKRIVMFSTKNNPTTRENIINIFGAKTMTALVPLDLTLEMEPSTVGSALQPKVDAESISKEVKIVGHVSRPSHGEGRQTPDRQMFFINGRPCGLPQFAKTFNEVYKSYNSNQSPFIFADIQMDTHMYDVNVSPDKRTILLHDQGQLLDSIRESLIELFDSYEYTVPASHLKATQKSPFDRGAFSTPSRTQTLNRSSSATTGVVDETPSRAERELTENANERRMSSTSQVVPSTKRQADDIIDRWVQRKAATEAISEDENIGSGDDEEQAGVTGAQSKEPHVSKSREPAHGVDIEEDRDQSASEEREPTNQAATPNDDEQEEAETVTERDYQQWASGSTLPAVPTVQHLRGADRGIHVLTKRSPAKRAAEPAQVFIGDPITPAVSSKRRKLSVASESADDVSANVASSDNEEPMEERPSFGAGLSQKFAAGGSQPVDAPVNIGTKLTRTIDIEPPSGKEADEVEADEVIEEHSEGDSEASEQSTGSDPEEAEELAETYEDSEGADEPNDFRGKAETAEGQATARAQSLQTNAKRKDTTLDIIQEIVLDENRIRSNMELWQEMQSQRGNSTSSQPDVEDITAADAESKLSLIIQKSDFGKMRVAGQFNLGFIIAVRSSEDTKDGSASDELFIVDQHASDEKYNFERLQDTTVVQSQRLVHPKTLELTALEEEIVMQNTEAIEANGFKIDVNTDGELPVGSRCQLTSLPLSRETIFDVRDLEELISLLSDESSESKHIPRPSKVRKMFAMRACRSSIMIGKALTRTQMYNVLGHMGELDKPWNCPHGRPTMRHLCKLQAWDEKGWVSDECGKSDVSWGSYARGD